jgi:Family of unknown function (DUF5906)/Bifunctional DNA primase/polymerase, N-terminal
MAAMKVNDRATNVYRLRDFLKKRYISDVLMPINADTKSPKFSHKGGGWTWDDLERQLPRLTTDDVEPDDVCILVKELVVVDADTNEACEALEEKHAAFRNTPKVKTKKGAHYYLERTPYCDEIGLYNGVRSKHAVEEDQQIDVRTITATGTAGVVVAPPSTNKEWVVSPWERPILEMPNEVADWLKELMNPLNKSSVGESGNQGRDGSTPGHEVPIEEHMHIIEVAEELLARVGGHDKCRYIKVTKNNLGFSVQFKGDRSCPGGKEKHVNNTFFVQLYNDGNAYYYCQSKECQQSYPLGKYITLQMVEEAEETEHNKRMLDVRFDPGYANSVFEKVIEGGDLDKLMAYTNRFFAAVRGPKPEIVEEVYNKSGKKRLGFIRRAVRCTKEAYSCCPWLFKGYKSKECVVKGWFEQVSQRWYTRYVFAPRNDQGPREYNMFCGLKVENKYDMKNWVPDYSKIQRILGHIYEVMVGGDKTAGDYFLTWLKVVFKERRKTGICPVFSSDQGTGKSTLWNWILEQIIGTANPQGKYEGEERGLEGTPGVRMDSEHQLTGKFNVVTVARLLILCDEIGLFGGCRQQSNKMKGLISETSKILERKGLDAFPVADDSNIVITTNEPYALRVEIGDRRYFVPSMGAHRVCDNAYFAALLGEMNAEGAAANFYHYVWNWEGDTSIIGRADCIPKTKAKQDLLNHSLPSVVKFIRRCIRKMCDGESTPEKSPVFTLDRLYPRYTMWFKTEGYEQAWAKPVALGEFKREFCLYTGLKQKNVGRHKVFDHKYGIVLPLTPQPVIEHMEARGIWVVAEEEEQEGGDYTWDLGLVGFENANTPPSWTFDDVL